MTTSVTGKPQRASEAPAALVIITRDDIRRSPAKDIPGLLRAYGGVDVARWTASQSDVSIRGGVQPYNPRLLVLVNGRQVYLDHYGVTNWAAIGVQLHDIQQIEIVKGPNSALFGFNAVSGVINIITVNPLQTQQVAASVEAGDRGYGNLSATIDTKLNERFGLHLAGGYGGSDELDGLARSLIAPRFRSPDPRHAEGVAVLHGRLDEKTEAAVSATRAWDRQTELVNVPVSTPARTKLTSYSARISHDAGWGVLSGRLYQNHADIEAPLGVGSNGRTEMLDLHNKVVVASAAALFRVDGSNTARIGAEYRDNELETAPGYPGPTRYHIYAVNGMWESAVADSVTLTAAGRLDRLELRQEGVVDQPSLFTKQDFDRTINAWSLNGAALFKLDASNTLRLAAGRGVQAPSLFNLGSRLIIPVPGAPFPVVSSGDPTLEPSILWSGEVGFTHAFDDRGGRLELNAFYSRTNHVISSPSTTTTPRLAPPAYPFILTAADNVGSFEAYGLEASLAGRLGSNLSWSANYTWTKAKQHIKGEVGDRFEWPIALDRSTPEHKIRAQISYEQGAWLGTVLARYNSAIQQLIYLNGPLAPFDIDDTLTFDAKLAFRFSPKLTFEIAGENLTDAAGADLSPAPAERRMRAGLRVQF